MEGMIQAASYSSDAFKQSIGDVSNVFPLSASAWLCTQFNTSIESLEARISDLQHGATLATPGVSLDQPIDGPSRHLDHPQITNGFLNPPSGSDQPEMTFMAPLDNSNGTIYGLDILQSDDNLFSVSHLANHDTSTNSQSDLAMPVHVLGRPPIETESEH
ncbi:hypothetical protein CEP52_016602 [Fusarium oligoseptatum]|uniref:Uncharacterized protein n=1 Tax=Fusarium oligoseptatum TaxID=2604345 RepID=A0A428S217_9HYPO|nr:hypothetical protein CEP52_016602 [Fusarium oligoseptatum]